jgi:cell division septation protein DedD
VQVSATTDQEQAAAIAARLRRQGYDAYTLESPMRGQTLYRVRVGRFASRERAQEMEGRLKQAGHENAYITPQ